MENNEISQELLFKLSMFEQQIKQIQEQIQSIENAIVEMGSLNIGLSEIIGGKEKEILSPIGRGIYVKSKIVSEELTVDVGGKNFVKKSVPETKEIIENQMIKLEEIKKDLIRNLENIDRELNETIMEAQKKKI